MFKGGLMALDRQTVDLSEYPDLVVIHFGLRVRRRRGLSPLLRFGPQIQKSRCQPPDGLLLHEDLIWSLIPPYLGMRQYWRDLDSLNRWCRSEPHRLWWQQFLKEAGETGIFWHETHLRSGGIEAVYDDTNPTGLSRVAPLIPARDAHSSSRRRAGQGDSLATHPLS
jgi:hypothetical protein